MNKIMLSLLLEVLFMKIEVKNIEKTKVAYVSVTGPYEQLPELFGEVVDYVMNEDLKVTEPPYGIYFNSPRKYHKKS
jgi:AraC family transcriptional regulator